jgi:hypothetical protein
MQLQNVLTNCDLFVDSSLLKLHKTSYMLSQVCQNSCRAVVTLCRHVTVMARLTWNFTWTMRYLLTYLLTYHDDCIFRSRTWWLFENCQKLKTFHRLRSACKEHVNTVRSTGSTPPRSIRSACRYPDLYHASIGSHRHVNITGPLVTVIIIITAKMFSVVQRN